MSNDLNVYLRGDKVGRLSLDARRHFVFIYDQEWLTNTAAVPLSLHLPLHAEPFADEQARPFFANLLPESDLRRALARKLGLSEQNDFALLEAVGGECAGAVSLLPDNMPLPDTGSYRILNEDDLNALVDELPTRPMLAGEQGIRLSLAGAQNKLPVHFDGQHISVPLDNAPSSHILKPPIVQYPHSVENEYFCMRLAERVGLSVPRVTLLRKRKNLYLIERYDRDSKADGSIERIHQEDFCQALGILPDQKYEKEGGPGIKQCFMLLRDHSVFPVSDMRALLDWVVFNYLIGNADAHAKNISLLLMQDGPRLAPCYDLMCTAAYPDLTDKLAMKIGGEDRPSWIIARRWQAFAEDIGVAYKLVRQRLLFMKESIHESAQALRDEFIVEHGSCIVIDNILGVINQRYDKITAALVAENEA
ncbi:MAG: type II toxin-antitoxin system HipA family toxin [Gammaproteobacteria bacterium]|nr:type II toxin-antitoxin system HipA family toxin [Gammaproteobacteria bacterium]